MGEPLIGEIRLFGGNFAPSGWAFCHGQLLEIHQHRTLFAVIGAIYGGDGQTTFALPDLRSRIVVNQGQGTGLTRRIPGEVGGADKLSRSQKTDRREPFHSHSPVRNPAGKPSPAVSAPSPMAATSGAMGEGTLTEQVPPYLGLNYIIALEGVVPLKTESIVR
ncbi:phage tail protein [Alkalinema pantanalense CENA528]|uniref:phage tail protein n=1 Tax=Alkalinema pantanalense TaxID=1620705 RepID=UPI003D6F8688